MDLVTLRRRPISPASTSADTAPERTHTPAPPPVDMTWVAELTDTRAQVHCAQMPAGSTLPRHPTPVWQVFAVVAGEGTVASDDDVPHPIGAGTAAVWAPGEVHTSWATTDMTVVIVQSHAEPTLPTP